MNLTKTFTALGCSLVVTAAGCQVEKSLGDLPSDQGTLLGGGGESGEGSTSSGGSALGSGGTTADAGRDSSGGTTADAGKGGSAGTTPEAGAPSTGATGGTGSSGTGSNSTGGSAGKGGGCNSPHGSPPVVSEDAPGCPCNENEPDACVFDRSTQPYWEIAFTCAEGRWRMVEDGACYPQGDGGARCVVDNHIYWSGGEQSVPDPFSCNTCACTDGKVNACTEIGCSEPCPPGTVAGERCMRCGTEDACLDLETGCFPTCTNNDDCDFACVGGMCVEQICL
jgi:hypothetical protein